MPAPPADPATRWIDAMRGGDWPAAFAVNDAVLAARDPATRDDPALPYHLRWVWDGTPPDDRDVIVRCYHGLGDTLQFARYLPALARRARSVVVEAQPALIPILRGLDPSIRFAPFDPAAPLPPRDVAIEIMELAHALRLPPDAGPVPYLHAPAAPPLPPGTLGLCWQAGDWDAARGIDLAALLAAIGPDRPLISLQRGPAAAQAGARFLNPGDDDRDVRATAALIGATACVVTCDTMVAHLAGALGAPCLVLLKADADWRWMTGLRTAWYPRTVLVRQDRAGNWSKPLNEIAALLTVPPFQAVPDTKDDRRAAV